MEDEDSRAQYQRDFTEMAEDVIRGAARPGQEYKDSDARLRRSELLQMKKNAPPAAPSTGLSMHRLEDEESRKKTSKPITRLKLKRPRPPESPQKEAAEEKPLPKLPPAKGRGKGCR